MSLLLSRDINFHRVKVKVYVPCCWRWQISQLHSMRYLPAVGFPTPSRLTFSAVISSRGERDRSFSAWGEPRMVLPAVFCVSCTSRCRCQMCCNYTPVAALLGGLCRPCSGGKASGHGCSPSRPRSLPALTSWWCSAFQEGNFWIGEIRIDIEE